MLTAQHTWSSVNVAVVDDLLKCRLKLMEDAVTEIVERTGEVGRLIRQYKRRDGSGALRALRTIRLLNQSVLMIR